MAQNSQPGNILFIMCDQLRFDYLGCYGHPTLHTPNIDALASRGVRFTNAWCNSPLCGPSRASFYTGRYAASHGVYGNNDFTRLDEMMISDYLRPLGYRAAVTGKTHSRKNSTSMKAMGVDMNSAFANAAASGGFEPFELHEGLLSDPILKATQFKGYHQYLHSKGYESENPWQDNANSGIDADGRRHSGWALRSACYPADIDEQHSETAFTTDRAMDFIRECGNQPWCLHLSYIKPHWPVIAAAPYHDMYAVSDISKAIRCETERNNPHPVYQAFMQQEYSQSFASDDVRETVIPAYMGLVKQIDDHLGRLFDFLKDHDLEKNTLIVFTADHGDYLGDHWLGEKDLFHNASAKLPFILVDPRPDADSSRGQVCEHLVEAVDLLPSLIEYAGGESNRERLEGQSLLPVLHHRQESIDRDYVISEIDYSERNLRQSLGLEPYQCRATMVCNKQWKYIHHLEFESQLFDLTNDPDELQDLGKEPGLKAVRAEMKECLFDWQARLKRRSGMNYQRLLDQSPEQDEKWGIIIGRW
ncbi:MAG: sulfatase-like hydrolase/transferase [Pseudomonadota bacterium]